MAMYTVEIDNTFDLPRRRVFALFADHYRFGKLLGVPIRRVKDSDQADPNGAGSVRKIGIRPLSLEETVTHFEPDALIEYTITGISPIRNHLGRIRFEETSEGGTRVNYTIMFDHLVPFTGQLISSALERGIRRRMKRVPQLA